MGLPLLIISSLRLRRPEKLALVFIFCMGGLSIAASVSRFAILYPYIKTPPLTTQTIHVLEVWGTVEMAAAVIAFSLPSLRVLYIRILGLPSHIQVTPNSKGNSSGKSRSRKRTPGNTTDNSTLWTIGGGQIDSEGNRIVVKKTFDVHRETWPPSDDLEMGSINSNDRVDPGVAGVAIGGPEGSGFVDPTRRAGRSSATGFGGYATAEVGSIDEGNLSQERLRPATKDMEISTHRHHDNFQGRVEEYDNVELEIQDSGDLLRRGNNASQIHLNDQGGLLNQGNHARTDSDIQHHFPRDQQ